MGKYADIKIKRIKRFLKYISKKKYITIGPGGKHQMVIKYDFADRPMPVPIKHGVVDKYILNDIMEKLINWGVCTQEEIDKHL